MITKIKILAFSRYFAESLFFPFIALYLANLGYTTVQIGIFIAAIPFTSIIFNPIYSAICKKPFITKTALTIMSLIEGILLIILLNVHVYSWSLVIMILISIVTSSNYGLIDSLIALSCEQKNYKFSAVRIFGSFAYMVGTLVAGFIAKATSYTTLFYIAAVLFILVSVFYWFVDTPQSKEKAEVKLHFKDLLKNKVFVLYVIFYVLLLGTMFVADDFYSIYLKSKGSPDYVYSYLMLGYLGIEVLTMFIISRAKIKNTFRLFFLAVGILVVRLFVQALPVTSVQVLIGIQLLRGITMGITLSLSSIYVVKVLGFNLATKGIMLITLCFSIFTALFKAFGGKIIDMLGYPLFYQILFLVSVVCFGYFCFFYFYQKKTLALVNQGIVLDNK